ncbi:ECF transporter S component [Clostridium guangxiense]|uniref:ECF transporter S component n=1 Tax=Clostridium guangxiense TaxID=1662055 RepID=UPI001E32382B|nr:ECF transporter S component [Clostridium guangxiense]MCD2346518.1 ECF transporter S component [Clostridium guangxiense]
MKTNIKKLTFSALLTALAIVIPVVFGGFLRITIPPFSATLASHVPMFIAMLISPEVAIIVGIGSAFGFLITATPVIAARALTHAAVGFVGAILIRRGVSFRKTIALTAPVHAILEALIVIPFGFTAYNAIIVVGIGTILHHFADGVISSIFASSIEKALKMDFKKIAA